MSRRSEAEASTAVVRVSQGTHILLRSISEQTGETMQRVVERAVEDHHRKLFWERTNAAYASLRSDEGVWNEESAERKAWDATLADDVEEEGRG